MQTAVDGTISSRQSNPPQTAQDNAKGGENNLQRQPTEKKYEDRFYVDDNYYALNPWYEREPPRPLYGLGRPFPRTVRPGMLWGRKQDGDQEHGWKEQDEGQYESSRMSRMSRTINEQVISDHAARKGGQGAPVLQIPARVDEYGEQHPPPDQFEADIGGRKYIVIRAEQGVSTDLFEHGVGREDPHRGNMSEPESHHGLQSPRMKPHSIGDKFHGDHPPLVDSKSTDTAQTQAEKDETHDREDQAIQEYYNTYRNGLSRLRARYPEAFSEFLATTIYLLFGMAGTLYSIIYPAAESDYITQSWAWGMAVMAGIYVGGGVSGSHMSPWVSIAFSIYRGFPWRMCLVYCFVQMLAGFAAGSITWFIYRDAIMHIDPQLTPSYTGKAFYTMPMDYVSTATAFFNDFLAAALYTCVAFAIGDDSNTPPGSGMSALIYGLMSFLLCITFGYNGLGVSPARDLGPRFIAWWVGYGSQTFSTGWWAYGPIGAGLSGVLTGAFIYDAFIFVGNESPLNYNWPSPKELRDRTQAKKKQARENLEKIGV
ncbi:aquaporin-like protein [Bimuria novae-zelandiae CBS 107.79]|uniref:Aquaporin-like protein n=1 Tax=Bimuria novae-zelandiae CBS 107.79 TaxID=1447943 RepID=A0A6A5V9I6_9PLEO|nr:aquaporin-like protein [Bimuria novae-zelandiae CBS 107.79]